MAQSKTQFGYRRHPDQDRTGADHHDSVLRRACGRPVLVGMPAISKLDFALRHGFALAKRG